MLDVAVDAAKQAARLTYGYFKKQPKVSYKSDNSPVTLADIEAEKLIKKIIAKKFPDHGFIGEEFGNEKPNAKYQWVIDPIDGTRDFSRQTPFWCNLIAVLENGKPIIGVILYPAFNELFTAQKNKGTYLNGKKSHVSTVSNFERSYLLHTQPHHFEARHKMPEFVKMCKIVHTTRNIGSYSYSLLLKGHADVYVAGHGAIYDFAAPSIVVEEAGGKFSDFDGKFKLDSDTAIFSNGRLHQRVINIINNE